MHLFSLKLPTRESQFSSCLSLSLPREINIKFPLQPHQKYHITQYEGVASDLCVDVLPEGNDAWYLQNFEQDITPHAEALIVPDNIHNQENIGFRTAHVTYGVLTQAKLISFLHVNNHYERSV